MWDFQLAAACTVFTALAVLLAKPFLYNAQSYGYSPLSVFKKNKTVYKNYAYQAAVSGVFTVLLLLSPRALNPHTYSVILAAAFCGLQIIALNNSFSLKQKKKLAYTRRLIRLYIAVAAVCAAVVCGGFYTLYIRPESWYAYSVPFAVPAVLPVLTAVAFWIVLPFEKANNARYIRRAKIALDRPVIKIGITGSYGKTSVKNILKTMLSQKYTVSATEGNFNTPLGIALAASKLTDDTEVFIAEMGARRKGDIKQLCNIIKPFCGVVTGVCAQHLETFKTLDNVYAEKLSWLRDLPPDGFAVVEKGLRGRVTNVFAKVITVGNGGDITAENIRLGEEGTEFELVVGENRYLTKTKLLGAHNAFNVAVCAAVALQLGVKIDAIVRAAATAEPVPHRLELIKTPKLTIIDDTYNANPKGVRQALDVLQLFGGKKSVVTPGLVELGSREYEENYLFGKEMAKVANQVLLIGKKRTQPIKSGLLNAGFDEKNIYAFDSLAEAENQFTTLFAAGDTVLFCNDLPDIYNE